MSEATPSAKRHGYGADPVHAYGLLTPRFWHGMTPDVFWRLAWEGGLRMSAKGWATSATITGVGVGNALGALCQRAMWGERIARVRLATPPLFVLGHWRSGTTMLHELLMSDPDNTCPSTYQCFSPQHFLVSESWLTPLIGWLLPSKRPMDNVAAGWDRPQEDEFALMNLGLRTPYRSWAFPRNGPVDGAWLTLDGVPAEDRRRWVETLRWFVHAVSLRRPGRVVLKSPPHTARLALLLEAFPDARFVHISRDPMVLFPSTVRLWKSLADVQGLQSPARELPWIEEEVLGNLVTMYAALARDEPLAPPGRFAQMRYEDLVADPKTQLRRVYSELDLGDTSAIDRGVEAHLAETGSYRTNRYELPPEVAERVSSRWRSYAERYGYA